MDAGPADRVLVFDTTMRDGEQAPGINLDAAAKVRIAAKLEQLGVDVIEAGFPAASKGDFDAVRAVAASVRRPVVAALARALPGDLDRAAEALAPARAGRLHTFVATSTIHMDAKLRMSKTEVLETATGAVRRARLHVPDVQFATEDSTRSDPEFLKDVYAAAIAAGATICNVADTVGYMLPHQFADLLGWLMSEVPGADRVLWSVHCHDDLGVAVALSLAGVRAGVRQVEVAVNGIGERAGNCALEEIVMALRTHAGSLGLDTGVDTTHIAETSRLVSELTGYPVPRNKAVVGANAFAHESGIHQHGVLADRRTYEHLDAAALGFTGGQLVLGKHSGRHALAAVLADQGTDLTPVELDEVFGAFKTLADERGTVSARELADLAARVRENRPAQVSEMVEEPVR